MLLITYLQKYVFQVKQDVNVKVFNMIPRTNYVKTLIKHMACDCKCKFKCQCECKKYRTSIKDYGWNPSACICGSSRYLKSSVVVDSVVVCDTIISVTDRVSTNVINKYQCFSKF